MVSRTLSVCLAAAGFALSHRRSGCLPRRAPASKTAPEAGTALVQEAGYYKRRWRYKQRQLRTRAFHRGGYASRHLGGGAVRAR